ncbi:MAG: cation:proton antiporter [Candidatus Aenigmatarchaeota archaeon]|nr:MAG: cation:proton antiporter [Candidatus Aenigmarchaeota archaeon]
MELMIYLVLSSIGFCLFRAIKGPTIPDRVIALDATSSLIVVLILILSLKYPVFADVAIIYALLGFTGTLAIAKYLEGKGLGE